MEQLEHIIITSAPRSGSTPLAKLLGRQKDLFVTNELGTYDDWDNPNKWKNYIGSKDWINFTANKPIFEAHNLDLYKFRQNVIDNRLGGKQIFRWMLDNTNVKLLGDKCPITYLRNMPMFATKFPNAKFIIVIRDGREVVASQIRGYHKWPPGDPDHAPHWMKKNIESAQYLWLNISQIIIKTKSIIPEKRLLVFRYEEAVSSPKDFCEKLSYFLGAEIKNINDYFKATNLNRWQKDHPNMMEQLSIEFKDVLDYLGY
jgi:hypothetical protein